MAAWERPLEAAFSHRVLAASRRDHWLRRLRCAAGRHCRRDKGDGVGDGEEGSAGRRTGVAAQSSIVSPNGVKDFSGPELFQGNCRARNKSLGVLPEVALRSAVVGGEEEATGSAGFRGAGILPEGGGRGEVEAVADPGIKWRVCTLQKKILLSPEVLNG